MRKFGKFLNKVIDTILVTMVAIILAVLIGMICGITPYVVMSGSMEPAIPTGSLCFVNENKEFDEIEVEDIVAFEVEDIMVTHRVIDITSKGFITKGDNNNQEDGLSTTRSNYCGETFFHIPQIGYVVATLQTKRGMILSGTVIISLFIISLMLEKIEETEEKSEISEIDSFSN